MSIITLTGVDPGIVHSGVVLVALDTYHKTITVYTKVVAGVEHAPLIVEAANQLMAAHVAAIAPTTANHHHMYIEQYLDRGSTFGTHKEMRKTEVLLTKSFPKAKLVSNTGVKKVITRDAMRLFGAHDFPKTHHQDLESALRIALYGAAKDNVLNLYLSQIVGDYLMGEPWTLSLTAL